MEGIGEQCKALLDNGAFRIFINFNYTVVERLGLETTRLVPKHRFKIANGEAIIVNRAVHLLSTICNELV